MARRVSRGTKAPTRWVGDTDTYGVKGVTLTAGVTTRAVITNLSGAAASLAQLERCKVLSVKGYIGFLNTDATIVNDCTMGIIALDSDSVAAGGASVPDPSSIDDIGQQWWWQGVFAGEVAQNTNGPVTWMVVNLKPKRWLRPDESLILVMNTTDASNVAWIHLRALISKGI